jgi:hypothetical protein
VTPWLLVAYGAAMGADILLVTLAGALGIVMIRRSLDLPTRELHLPRIRFRSRKAHGARVAP